MVYTVLEHRRLRFERVWKTSLFRTAPRHFLHLECLGENRVVATCRRFLKILSLSGEVFNWTMIVVAFFNFGSWKTVTFFECWNFVLNNSYLADNEEDFDRFYASKAENVQHQIRASWDKIFDLERFTPNWDCPPERLSIQATLWQVDISQVKKVEFFTAK